MSGLNRLGANEKGPKGPAGSNPAPAVFTGQLVPASQYRLDFAWVKKKRCIEIDGKQHQRNKQQAESDLRKDAKLIENGWQVLRIKWKEFYADPKRWISIAENFIGE